VLTVPRPTSISSDQRKKKKMSGKKEREEERVRWEVERKGDGG
jgi:hypothetical protein